MGFIDTAIGIIIVTAFVTLILSRVYNHEKEVIDPLIKKIKGWFSSDEDDDFFGPDEDFNIEFKGQQI